MGQLLKQKKVTEARQLFYEILKIRPDIRLEHSDLLGEIPIIELILYICECEQQHGIAGMLDFSTNLRELVAHVRRVRKMRKSCGAPGEDARNYLKDTKVSDIMMEVLARNGE